MDGVEVHLNTITSHPNAEIEISFKGSPMKAATIVGILLVLLGIVGFATGGFSFTHKEKDAKLGPVEISHNEKETVPVSPILSGIAVIAGLGLVFVGVKNK